jgi:hypothetical protein
MTAFHCLIASTQRELDDALRVRWAVSGARLPRTGHLGVPRQIDCFDTLDTTVHFVVYADGEPVATTRLLLPDAEVAQTHGPGLIHPGRRVAKTTPAYVLPAWRGSEALPRMHAALHQESRRLGVTHWMASALSSAVPRG